MRAAAVDVRDAATVILVSDRPDLHVLVLERTSQAVFGPGATVFPGGAVDPADRDTRSHARVVDLADKEASAEHGLLGDGLAFRIAAVRECFEESGILLARDAGTGSVVHHDDALAAARVRSSTTGRSPSSSCSNDGPSCSRPGSCGCSPTG